MEVVTIDIITYALCKKLAAGAVSGVSNMRVDGTKLIITTNDGQELTMTFPTPEQGVSIIDVKINDNGELVCYMSDGNIINVGALPTAPIPVASETTLGGIKVGKNLKIDADGTLSAVGGSGTGTSDYNDLENKPTLNGIEISGERTAADYGIKEDKTYVFTQVFETTEWNIVHNLNKYPSVIVVDNDMFQVWAEIQYVDLNTIKVIFTQNFTGKAFLN